MDLTHITDTEPTVDDAVVERRRTLAPVDPGSVVDAAPRPSGGHDLRREGVSPYVWARIVVLLVAMAFAVVGALGLERDTDQGPDAPPPSVLVQDG